MKATFPAIKAKHGKEIPNVASITTGYIHALIIDTFPHSGLGSDSANTSVLQKESMVDELQKLSDNDLSKEGNEEQEAAAAHCRLHRHLLCRLRHQPELKQHGEPEPSQRPHPLPRPGVAMASSCRVEVVCKCNPK